MGKSELWERKTTETYNSDKNNDMEGKNTCIYLTIVYINLITVLLLADMGIFNRTLDRITV